MIRPAALFDQADELIRSGRPEDIRRAISSAYYALFHAALTAAADRAVGRTQRGTPLYSLAYRRIEHRDLRALCEEYGRAVPSPRYRDHLDGHRDGDLIRYAGAVRELYNARMLADYDPTTVHEAADARLAVRSARAALASFKREKREEKRRFLTLLHFSPR